MGGLKPEITEDIRMFRPRTLKEAISLARMKDDQITRQQRLFQPPSNRAPPTLPPTQASPTVPVKRLPWDEMQRRRAQGLCFTCNERFTAGHKCQGPQLLLLQSYNNTNKITCEEVVEELHGKENKGEQPGKTQRCGDSYFPTWPLRTRVFFVEEAMIECSFACGMSFFECRSNSGRITTSKY